MPPCARLRLVALPVSLPLGRLAFSPACLWPAPCANARVSWLEALAALCGLLNIALLARRSVWNYPFGMAMVAIYAGIFISARLYAVAGLQLFFFLAQVIGLWAWWRAPAAAGAVAVRAIPARWWPAGRAARASPFCCGKPMRPRPGPMARWRPSRWWRNCSPMAAMWKAGRCGWA